MKYKYTKEQLENIVKESLSIADVCRKMDIRPVGGNYKTLNFKFKIWNIDISHFTGAAWNQGGRYHNIKEKQPLNEILIENSSFLSTGILRIRLIKEGLKEYKCEKCGITEWENKPIQLELDHVNGKNMDNRIENLNILCPNCHSQTPFHRGRNREKSAISEFRKEKFKKEKKIKELKICTCGQDIKNKRRKYCSKQCAILHGSKVQDRPTQEQLLNDIKKLGYAATGRKYGVSDNAIRKWLK